MFPTFHFNIERWKYNPTFELYVSTKGRIRNKSKADIAPKVNRDGYLVVYVHGSLNKYMLLHRVVMLTWRPTPEAEELTVDHKNHNKRDNSLDNLEWVSSEENQRRAKKDYISAEEEKELASTFKPLKYTHLEITSNVNQHPLLKKTIIEDNDKDIIHFIFKNKQTIPSLGGFTDKAIQKLLSKLISMRNSKDPTKSVEYMGVIFTPVNLE